MQGEKVHPPGAKENADAPGAFALPLLKPRFEIMFFLPGPGFQVTQGNRMRPRPQWGLGWRKGDK